MQSARALRLDRLIDRYGIDAKLFDWLDEITANCPRKQAMNLNDICGARCPDLPKVARCKKVPPMFLGRPSKWWPRSHEGVAMGAQLSDVRSNILVFDDGVF